jgi:general secretion pathway protein I
VTGAGRYKSLVSRFQPLDLSLKPLASNLQGFTLLEVLVALAVLAVALVSLLGLQNRNLLLSMQAERLSTGTLLVREMLTRTQLEGPDAARVTSGDFADFHPGQYPEFRWHRTVRPAPLEGLWELWVSVTWGERADEQAELTLFTPLG